MSTTRKHGHKLNKHLEESMEYFAFRHPYISYLALFIGMPISILAMVFVCTVMVAVPVAWLLGWL